MVLICAECQCAPVECTNDINNIHQCKNCIKPVCCCIDFHQDLLDNTSSPSDTQFAFVSRISPIVTFLRHAKGIYAAALGIEILCIAAAEIGENSGLYMFGFNPLGITIAYAMGYALAGFTTFATILGRYNYGSNQTMCSCCSVLEQARQKGFVSNLKITFRNFAVGIKKLPYLYKQQNLKTILKTSLTILITVESVCILTAETVDLIFYKYSILLSIPLALIAGAFIVVAPEAYRKTRTTRIDSSKDNGFISFQT
jgi:hypothetical protein